jgi:16S rRNA processing protein RimM
LSGPSYIIIGKIGTAYGTRGWLKITAYTQFNKDILGYRPWYTKQADGPWLPVEIEASKPHGKGAIVKLAGIHTPEKARLLTGSLIGVCRSQLPKLAEGEYYWSDLIGLSVINKEGGLLGTVRYLMETGSNDVLVIKGEKEIAIPFIQGSVIQKVDLEKRTILVDWELI